MVPRIITYGTKSCLFKASEKALQAREVTIYGGVQLYSDFPFIAPNGAVACRLKVVQPTQSCSIGFQRRKSPFQLKPCPESMFGFLMGSDVIPHAVMLDFGMVREKIACTQAWIKNFDKLVLVSSRPFLKGKLEAVLTTASYNGSLTLTCFFSWFFSPFNFSVFGSSVL